MDMAIVNKIQKMLLRKMLKYDDNGESAKCEAICEAIEGLQSIVDKELSLETEEIKKDYISRYKEKV